MLGTEFYILDWLPKYRQHVLASPLASASWETLTKAGCSPFWLALGAAFSCEFDGAPAYEILGELKRDGKQLIKHVKRLAGRLEADRQEVLELLSDEKKLELGDEASASWSRFADSSADVIVRLKSTAATTQREISGRNLKPTLFLVLLSTYVQEKTGKPHYRDAVELLDAAYATFGKPPAAMGDESLRKAIDRFKRRNPGILSSVGEIDTSKFDLGLIALVIMLAVVALQKQKDEQPQSVELKPDKPPTGEPSPVSGQFMSLREELSRLVASGATAAQTDASGKTGLEQAPETIPLASGHKERM